MAFNYQCTTDSDGAGGYIFSGKTLIIFFKGFQGYHDFFDPQIVLSAGKVNFGIKSRAPLQNP